MKRTLIHTLHLSSQDYAGKSITVAGWVRTVRASKHFGFIEINDGSNFAGLQIVYEEDLPNFDQAAKIGVGAAIVVEGKLVLTPEAKQPFELKARTVQIEGECPPEYPLQKKRHGFEFLRSIAHLRPRTNTFNAVFRVRSTLSFLIHSFFQERQFVYVQTPIITGSDCEGAGAMFRVTTLPQANTGAVDFTKDFFGRETKLTVSGQLNGETCAQAFGNVYTFGPTFRAEHSNTTRHAAEFWMVEPEMAFADLTDDMDLAEAMITYLITGLLERLPDEMGFFNKFVDKGLFARLENVKNNSFERISYTGAVDILQKSGKQFGYPCNWGDELQTEHERYLTEEVYKKPVFVTDYPEGVKPFYMRRNDDGKTVAAMDLLVPGVGEIIGGSQREERLGELGKRITDNGMDPGDYSWYLDLRRYGTTKHAGFGLGFERCLMYVTGMANIRDVISFPRTVGHAEF